MIETLIGDLLPGELPLKDTLIYFVDTLDDVLKFKRWISEARGRTILAVDTESAGLDPYAPERRIRLAQFGTENEAWVINCEKWAGIAQEVLETYTESPMTFHNIAFDYPYISACWPDLKFPWSRMHDTMLYHRLHDSEAVAGLKPVSAKLFGPDATKGQDALHTAMARNGWTWNTVPMSCPSYTIYSGGDVILTARLWQRLQHIHSGPFKSVAEMEMRIARICADMSIRGMRIDRPYCQTEQDKLLAYSQEVHRTLKEHYGFNPGSNPQLADHFLSMGATLTETTDTGAWSMSKDVLTRLAAEGFAVAEPVLNMRKAQKLATTYFHNLLLRSDNPDQIIHAEINTIAARTGRMSVSKPSLQNLPSRNDLVRGAFLPDHGEQLVTCDFSQIELRLTAHLSRDPVLLSTFEDCDTTGDDFFTRIGRDLYGPEFTKADLRRTLIKNVIYGCLPTDTTRILTDRGVLTYDEIRVGDRTIGFNPATGRNEWTLITNTQVYDDAPVVTFGHGKRSFTATENHRWVSERRRRTLTGGTLWETQIITTDEFLEGPKDTRLVLARPAHTAEIPLTALEEESLAWVINASGEGFIGTLPDAVLLAVKLSPEQRKTAIAAFHKVDGRPFSKSDEWTHEFYRSIMYLSGYSSVTSWTEPDGKSWTRKRRGRTHVRKSVMTRQRVSSRTAGTARVWCPTTELGTWTAEQNGELFLTGNSTYGAGVEKMAESAKVPLHVMQPIADNIFDRFAGIKGIQDSAMAEARDNLARFGRPFITTECGRRLFVDPDLIYTGANYKVQGLAADLMKKALISIDNAGLGQYMRLPVHDEIVMSVPEEDVYDVKHILQEAMSITTDMGFSVQIPAVPEGPFERWKGKS